MRKFFTLSAVVLLTSAFNYAIREGQRNPASASRAPERPETTAHAAGLDRPALIDRPAARRQGPQEGAALGATPAPGRPAPEAREKKPAPPPPPAPVAKPAAEPIMVGPDGVIFRRVGAP